MIFDLLRTYKKILLLVLLLVIGLGFWFFGCQNSEHPAVDSVSFKKEELGDNNYRYIFESDQFSGSLSLGSNGVLVRDKVLPVVVRLTCKEKTFTGLVRIILPGGNGKGIAYQSALNCEKGIHCKQILEIPQLGNSDGFVFEIVDQFETVLISKDIHFEDAEEFYDIGVGILCDNFEKYSYLDAMSIHTNSSTYNTRLVSLSEEFPSDIRMLSALSVIMIDNYSSNQLNQIQKNVLMDWVRNGGQLLIGGGANSVNNYEGLQEYLHVNIGDTEQTELTVFDDDTFLNGLIVQLCDLQLREQDNWKAFSWITPDAGFSKSLGEGKINLLKFSLSDNGLVHWMNREQLSQKLLTEMVSADIEKNTEKALNSMYLLGALHAFQESQVPATFTYASFFILYLINLVFFAYYMPGKMKRREYVWLIIPLISLVFTVLAGVRNIGNSPDQTSSFSAISIRDEEKKTDEVYLYYQNADGKKTDVQVNPKYGLVEPLEYFYLARSNINQNILLDYVVNDTKNGKEINLSESVPGVSQTLKISRKQETNRGDDQPNTIFKVKVDGDFTKFRGTIENTTDKNYKRVLLIRGKQYAILEDLKKHSIANIKGSDVKTWTNKEAEYPDGELGMYEGILNNLMLYLQQTYITDTNKMNQLIVIGISSQKGSDIFEQAKQIEREICIEVSRFKIKNTMENVSWIPDINTECLSQKNKSDAIASDMLSDRETEVTYQFTNTEHIVALKRSSDRFNGDIFAYNCRTEKMERILLHTDDQLDRKHLDDYLQEDDTIKIRYVLPEDQYSGGAPVLALIYDSMITY